MSRPATVFPLPLAEGSKTEFDPGDAPFGLWVANDGLADSDVYSQPSVIASHNKRLAKQPYKMMIYPFKDKATGQVVPQQLSPRLGVFDQRRLPGHCLPGSITSGLVEAP